MWPRTKRIIGIGWALCRTLSRKPLRLKLLWMLPEGWLAMRQIGIGEHQGARRHPIAIDFILLSGFAREYPAWRIQAQGLLKDHPGIGEPRKIVARWGVASQHNGEDFIANLLIRHALTGFLIARLQQFRQQIRRTLLLRTALLDQAIDIGIEYTRSGVGAAIAR